MNTTSDWISSVSDLTPSTFKNCNFKVLGSLSCSVGIGTLNDIDSVAWIKLFDINWNSAEVNPCDFNNVLTEWTLPTIGLRLVKVIFAIATWFWVCVSDAVEYYSTFTFIVPSEYS